MLIAMSDSEVNLEQAYEPGRSQEAHGNNRPLINLTVREEAVKTHIPMAT